MWRTITVGVLCAGSLAADGFDHPIKRFVPDARDDLKFLFTDRQNLWWFGVGGGVTALAAAGDHTLQNHFQDPGRGDQWDLKKWGSFADPGDILGGPEVLIPLPAAVFVASLLTRDDKFRDFSASLVRAFAINKVFTQAIKYGTRRKRPDFGLPLPNGAPPRMERNSFPSGHTSGNFAWASVVHHHYGWKAGVPAFLTAAYVGATRIEDSRHHLSDVVAGAVLGYVIGRASSREYQKHRSRFNLRPLLPPGGGMAVSLGITLD